MASLPSPTQVAGPHYPVYEAYYAQIDPNNKGAIEPLDAARFLKKSKLSDIVLGKIWDLSDPTARGFLNKQGFFVALKLCALAQSGRGISMDNITATDVPQPKMGDIPKLAQNKTNTQQAAIDWSVKPTEKAKYDQLFDSLQPSNGLIPGKKVRGVLMESKLPVDMLGRIWDLADIDKDGNLSRHEFMIAMHLVYKALEKYTIPATLPPELLPNAPRKPSMQSELIMPASKPVVPPQPVIPPLATIPPQPSRPPLPPQPLYGTNAVITQQPTVNSFVAAPMAPVPVPSVPAPAIPWVVSVEDKANSDALFARTDLDHDGFVSGPEIRDVFLQSGVPQADLAVIWGLCDTSQTGKLNNEQFALAMWFINRKINGLDPPSSLTPEMVPPCLRSHSEVPKQESNGNVMPQSTPELDLLATDIRQLSKERAALESDIAQKEAELRVKDSEVRSLQSELDTLAATLRQLDSQKGEAQKRLNDLKSQKSAVELELSEIIVVVEAEQAEVDKLRSQADEQEESLRSQESELNSKKQELESLKKEEQRLESQQTENKLMLDNLASRLQDSQLQISQVKAKVTQLEEVQRQMGDAVAACDSAISANDVSLVADTALSIGPEHRSEQITRLAAEPEPPESTTATFNDDANFDADFSNDAFSNQNGFGNSEPFGSSAFGSTKPADGPADPFNAFGAPAAKSDPFDPFTDGTSRAKTPADGGEKDPFGCDPFANLHAPERPQGPSRPESPSPALPPKKAKQPPPRPAPPRPAAPNLRAAPVPPTPSPEPSSVDPFSSSSGFDNFANFDGKFNNIAPKPSVGGLKAAPLVTSSSSSATPSPVTAPKNRYESFEFTEDPFKNYRYEDLSNIVDPFSDAADPFSDPLDTDSSSADAFEARFPKSDAFDVNFSPDDPFGGDFAKGDFLNGNKNDLAANLFNGKDKFSDNNANMVLSKTISVEAFKAQSTKKSDKPDVFISTEGLFSKKKKDDKHNLKSDSKSGRSVNSDDLQLAWAAQESLRLEDERRKQEQQEKADLEYAIALSKKDSGEKKTLRNMLRRGRNTPTT